MAATQALGKRPVMQSPCDCCGYHYDQEHTRLSQALADYDAQKEAIARVGALLDAGLDVHGKPVDFARIGGEAFRAHVESNKKHRRHRGY
jgi:hypothetical protein